jgi:hypothetical protein
MGLNLKQYREPNAVGETEADVAAMTDSWPAMAEWESTLPARGVDRLIAHTRLYHQHNLRLKARHKADEASGKFPQGSDESGTATRVELAKIFAKLRQRCTNST